MWYLIVFDGLFGFWCFYMFGCFGGFGVYLCLRSKSLDFYDCLDILKMVMFCLLFKLLNWFEYLGGLKFCFLWLLCLYYGRYLDRKVKFMWFRFWFFINWSCFGCYCLLYWWNFLFWCFCWYLNLVIVYGGYKLFVCMEF